MEVKEDVVQSIVVPQVTVVGGNVGVPSPCVVVVIGINEVGLTDAMPTGGALRGRRSPIAAAVGRLGDEDSAGRLLHFWLPQGRIKLAPLVAFPVPVFVATHVVVWRGRGAGNGGRGTKENALWRPQFCPTFLAHIRKQQGRPLASP